MVRRIPIFEFNEELSPKKHQVYKSLIDGVTEAIKENKKEIKLCEVKHSGIYITVEKTEWKKSLDSALQFYINKEEYDGVFNKLQMFDKFTDGQNIYFD